MNPSKSMYTRLMAEIRDKPSAQARFVRYGPGVFGLAPHCKLVELPKAALEQWIYCIPASGYGEFEIGNRVQVPPSWEALLLANEKVLASFNSGLHTLAGEPLVSCADAQGRFLAQMCFVNRSAWKLGWGTPNPIQLHDPDLELVEIKANGHCWIAVEDCRKLVVSSARIGLGDIRWLLWSFALDRFTNHVRAKYHRVAELENVYDDVDILLRDMDFLLRPMGLRATHFAIEGVFFTEETLDQIRKRPEFHSLLHRIDAKLGLLMVNVESTREGVAQLAQRNEKLLKELSNIDERVQSSFSTILEVLQADHAQEVVEVFNAIEQGRVLQEHAEYVLAALERALEEIRDRGLALPANVDGGSVNTVIDSPDLDLTSKLKLTLPIIPFLLEYEGELQLGSGLNLQAAWVWLKTKIRGEQSPARRNQ